MAKPKLLWIGDIGIASGFARVTTNVLAHLKDTFDVAVVGVLYNGDPHPYPYRIYTTNQMDGGPSDVYGLNKLPKIIATEKPDAVVVLNDPWIVAGYYLDTLKECYDPARVLAYMPVDGLNFRRETAERLNQYGHCAFYTQYGLDQARAVGFTGRATIIPHGVDLKIYRPMPKEEARKRAGLPDYVEQGYIVGCVGRNQPRKRIDLTLEYFADWIKSEKIDDAFLWLHCQRNDPAGIEPVQYASYLGIEQNVCLTSNAMHHLYGLSESQLPWLYSVMDIHVSTSQAEGWGLPQMESMACGIPNICPSWGGLGEWAQDAALMVPCSSHWVHPGQINTVHGIPDREEFVRALSDMYHKPQIREIHRRAGFEKVLSRSYRWPAIANKFSAVLRSL